MRRYGKGIGALAGIVLLITSTVWFGRTRRTVGCADESAISTEAESIRTVCPQRRNFTITCCWYGRVESRTTISVTALESGRVLAIEAEDGHPVQAGADVFRLGGPELDGRLAAAREKKAALEQQLALARDTLKRRRAAIQVKIAALREQIEYARARADQATQARTTNIKDLSTRLALARAAVERKQQNLKDKIATQDDLDQACREAARLKAEIDTAKQQAIPREKAALLQLQAEVKQAGLETPNDAEAVVLGLQAELESAVAETARLESAGRISAPAAGVFTRRTVNIGQDVAAGTRLAEIVDPASLRIVASFFPPPDAPLEGKTATIRPPGGKPIAAVVTKVFPERTSTGATQVWIEGAAVNRRLRPGETVSGEITLQTRSGVLAVPSDAVVRDEHEQTFVFLKKRNTYVRQPVTTGLESAGWVEVIKGISENGEIVVQGAYGLFYRDFSTIYKVAD